MRILRQVDVEEVERYYLQSEMLKLAGRLGWDIGSGSVNRLSAGELWPLCTAQSLLNQDYASEFFGRSDFEWFEAVCPVDRVALVDVDEKADTTQRSVHRNLTPGEFAGVIAGWRREYEPDRRPLSLKHIVLRQRGDEVAVLDGMHRFKRQVSEGATEVRCYYGRQVVGKPKRLTVTGPEIRRLRDLWRTAPDNDKEAIFLVTQHLMSISKNGSQAVEIFWIRYGREPETRAAGRLLLRGDSSGPDSGAMYN